MALYSIRTKKDIINYWKSCLYEQGKLDDTAVADKMLSVAANEKFTSSDWYGEGGNGDKLIVGVFDLVSEIATMQPNDSRKKELWLKVEDYLNN